MFPRLRTDLSANRAAFYMADLVGRMLQPEDPHPALFDQLVESLRILGSVQTADEPLPDGAGALLSFQWALLCETGYRPNIEHDASSEVAEFSPFAGGVVRSGEPVDGQRWKVRRSTLECLAAIGTKQGSGDASAVDRANRLLAAYLRHVLGAEPPTMQLVFARATA